MKKNDMQNKIMLLNRLNWLRFLATTAFTQALCRSLLKFVNPTKLQLVTFNYKSISTAEEGKL